VTDQPATAEAAVTLAPAHQSRGLPAEALTAVVTELSSSVACIESLLRRTIATCRVGIYWNSLGFRCDGRLVEADWFRREWSTLRLYAILDREGRARPGSTGNTGIHS
jgi:RimJ/RimL family protein N-acetyltransferase